MWAVSISLGGHTRFAEASSVALTHPCPVPGAVPGSGIHSLYTWDIGIAVGIGVGAAHRKHSLSLLVAPAVKNIPMQIINTNPHRLNKRFNLIPHEHWY